MRFLITLLALILAFASTASAAISLQINFDEFSGTGSGSALDDCRALYNSRINECTDTADFGEAYCRKDCQQALRNIEARLINFCKGVTAKQGTLLEGIFKKKLVELVCKEGGALVPQSSARLTTVTKPVATETAKVTTTKEDDGKEVTTTLKMTSSSAITATISTTTSAATTSAIVTISTGTSPSSEPAPTKGWREKARQDQACAILQGGGGSPFDNMISFKYPTETKDKQQRIKDCQGIAKLRVAQTARELEAKKNGASVLDPSRLVGGLAGLSVGLMVLA